MQHSSGSTASSPLAHATGRGPARGGSHQDHGETSYRGAARLAGRRALVIGADAGVGRAVAIAFAREGADIAVHYLPENEAYAQDVLALIRSEGGRVVAIPGDLRDHAFCIELVHRACDALGGIDILANAACAGEVPVEARDRLDDIPFREHLYAMFWLCRNAVPVMQRGAVILNTADIRACHPDAELHHDDASTQAAIVAFTRALVRHAGTRNIRVNLVRSDPMWSPLQRDGNHPTEIAALYVLLASPDSNLVSGEIYEVAGTLPSG
ncbi:SDR family oxidoreductase [Pigmentiphaga aceris]|nr:SDR family oxidoreductase [Pigmentiphaga aceris]